MTASPAVACDGAVVATSGQWVKMAGPREWDRAAEALGVDVIFSVDLTAKDEAEESPGPHWLETRDSVRVVYVRSDVDSVAGPFRGLDARGLRQAFLALEALGIPWRWSVGSTAQALIRSTHPAARGGRQPDRAVLPDQVTAQIEAAYTWARPTTAAERVAKYAHVFDANAQHLAAWGVVELGFGAPIHHQRIGFDARRAGVWCVDFLPPGLDPLMPPVAPHALGETPWLTTPSLARVLEVCDGSDAPTVLEAWLWPQKARYLRGAAERLRDARTKALSEALSASEALQAGDVASLDRLVVSEVVADAVKVLYQRQTGRFGAEWMDPASGMARPDWRSFVIGAARANLHRRIEKLGARPAAILTDALLFLSDEPDPQAFAERIRLPLGSALGQFKHERSFDAQIARDALSRGGPLWRAFSGKVDA